MKLSEVLSPESTPITGPVISAITVPFCTSDPSRIASNVVVGIGFIGAGAIFRAENKVKGITTAASLWVVAAVGMAVGLGYYLAAIVTALMVFGVLFIKRFISKGKKNSGYGGKSKNPANN